MSINVRSRLDGVEVDAVCLGRFFDRVEMREGAWRIAKRSVIYEKDRIDLSIRREDFRSTRRYLGAVFVCRWRDGG